MAASMVDITERTTAETLYSESLVQHATEAATQALALVSESDSPIPQEYLQADLLAIFEKVEATAERHKGTLPAHILCERQREHNMILMQLIESDPDRLKFTRLFPQILPYGHTAQDIWTHIAQDTEEYPKSIDILSPDGEITQVPTSMLIQRFVRRTMREVEGIYARETGTTDVYLVSSREAIARFLVGSVELSVQEAQLPPEPPEEHLRILVPNEHGAYDIFDASYTEILQLIYEELRVTPLISDKDSENIRTLRARIVELWDELLQNVEDRYFESGLSWMSGSYPYRLTQNGVYTPAMIPRVLAGIFQRFNSAMIDAIVLKNVETTSCYLIKGMGLRFEEPQHLD